MERIALWLSSLYVRARPVEDEEGQALVVFVSLQLVGTNLNTILTTVGNDL